MAYLLVASEDITKKMEYATDYTQKITSTATTNAQRDVTSYAFWVMMFQ